MQLNHSRKHNGTAVCPFMEAWLLLFFIEMVMLFRSSASLRQTIATQAVAIKAQKQSRVEVLSRVMDLACVFYFKRVLCLQRSAATTLFMRRHGVHAQMVAGAQILPPEFHAWVEVDGTVVNDKPYMHEIYQILERH